jgi:SAM-dependent methyltransferase
MDDKLQTNRELWEEWTDINSRSKMYDLDAFKQGRNKIDPLILSEMGDVTGKSMLHMQCHFGLDTLSWARLGADVTGADFSPKAIQLAQSLSSELNIPAHFICCDIYALPQHLQGKFDIVFASYGVLAWLPDFPRWMRIASSFLKPGGTFYLADGHPNSWVFDEYSNDWVLKYPYFQKEPMVCEANGSYADRSPDNKSMTSYQWQHTLGEIVTAMCDNGLRLEFLHEFGFVEFQAHPSLVEKSDGFWHHPDGDDRLPLLFSLKAVKPG